MPMDTKKTAVNRSRSGITKCSMVRARPLSAVSMPARNAPRATEKPAFSAPIAETKQRPALVMRRVSRRVWSATHWSSRGTRMRPMESASRRKSPRRSRVPFSAEAWGPPTWP